MAILNKEQYAYRNESAAKRMIENSTISSLTEEQHSFLSELCKFRHDLHCNQEALFLTESAKHEAWTDYICDLDDNASSLTLGTIIGSEYDYVTDMTYEFDDLDRDEAMALALENANELNNKIETFLQTIDETHGTNYCPTGKLRM